MRSTLFLLLLALAPAGGAGAQAGRTRPADPLAGAWQPVRLGATAVPASAEARLFFNNGSEYSTQAGCGNFGGFYSVEGQRIRVRPRDPVHTGKCPDRASARLEKALAGFVAQASTYALLPDGTLRIAARDGRTALFRRPPPAVPALDGPWIVERIGSDSVPYSRRATLNFHEEWVNASAQCNGYSARVRPSGSGFTITGGVATQMGCDPDRQAFDDRLFAAVAKARRWTALPGKRIRLEGVGEPLLLSRPPTLR